MWVLFLFVELFNLLLNCKFDNHVCIILSTLTPTVASAAHLSWNAVLSSYAPRYGIVTASLNMSFYFPGNTANHPSF